MKSTQPVLTAKMAILSASVALLISGCAYDYLQHSDRVGYSAGDAVKANLERETTDPSSDSQYDTSDLGKNGTVIKPETTTP